MNDKISESPLQANDNIYTSYILRRCIAKIVDIFLAGGCCTILTYLCIYIISSFIKNSSLKLDLLFYDRQYEDVVIGFLEGAFVSTFALPMISAMVIICYEAVFTGIFGTTIGKYFFGIKVLDADTQKVIGFQKGFKRAVYFIIFGTWCLHIFIPILSPIPMLISFFKLLKRKEARWDKDLNLVVIYQKPKKLMLTLLSILTISYLLIGIAMIIASQAG